MHMEVYFKSVLEQDSAPVVLCDLQHTILYMNPAAKKRYASQGGGDLVGKSLMVCHNAKSRDMIEQVICWFRGDRNHNCVYTFRNEKENKDVYMIALRDEEGSLIGYYEKHAYRSRESGGLYEMENSGG